MIGKTTARWVQGAHRPAERQLRVVLFGRVLQEIRISRSRINCSRLSKTDHRPPLPTPSMKERDHTNPDAKEIVP
jgi:hypothetical protein